ncbi:MAG: T9SS type A sorting domain-containing protein [Saprospiraceae bacterium]|nr:T9SS type A sorting domain-containing protein [Saprospiraceae bacterium]
MRQNKWKVPGMLLFCIYAVNVQAIIFFVKPLPTGTGSGGSWSNASNDLQAIINNSALGDQIWVAAGTYKPTQDPFGSTSPIDPRDKTFYIKDGVKIYGGFAGTETALSQRIITMNVTTLSGDIGIIGVASDNAYHVVLASFSNSTIGVTIDGFSIISGKADGYSSSLNINGTNIPRDFGGGIYASDGNNILTNNTISSNSAYYGGCCYSNNSIISFTSNTISGNSASNEGGGIYAYFGSITSSNNILSGNSAGSVGGGISTYWCATYINNSTFSANTAFSGGGIYSYQRFVTINNNTFSKNSAYSAGGGIYLDDGDNFEVINNTFSENSASNVGGGIYSNIGSKTIRNNTFSKNSATNNGGGFYANDGASLFKNNIFWGNKKGTNSTIANADFFNNVSSVNFTNNLMQLASSAYNSSNNNGLGTSPTNNIFATDPLFVDSSDVDGADNIHRTADDGLRLKPCSTAINVGDNTGVTATDIIGATRIQQTTVDLGAYENKDLTGYTLSSSVLNADAECVDGSNITHYYNSTNVILVLSIKKNGNAIGTIGDGTFAVTSGGSGVSNLGTSGTPAPYATAYNWYTMNRYWKVTPTTQPSSDVQVRFYYRPADYTNVQSIAGIANETNMVFYKINGTGNPDPTTAHTGTPIIPASAYNADGYWQYTNGATASATNWALGTFGTHKYSETVVAMFSGGGGGSGSGLVGGALPITLTSFKGRAQNKANVLEWSTSSEQNNKGFNLQHSANNLDFKNLGFILGSNGNTSKNYAYTHSNPFAGVNYYRLQQIDLDGKSSFSKTISIDNKLNGSIVAKPNPSNGVFTFQGIDFSDNDEKISYHLIDLLGKKIDAKVNSNTLDIRQEPNGIYYLQILQNGTIIQTTKLVKN